MSSLELMAVDWLGHGWLLILAFTAAVLVVVALRKPCRRLFGAERAFQLWSLVPLAMLVSQLPHAVSTSRTAPSALMYIITSALPPHSDASTGIGWRSLVMLVWCSGIVIALLSALFAQWRYRKRLRGATSMTNVASRWPVLLATTTDVGPALIGAWRTRIVLHADFEHRYDATERMLILAHETIHARRRDGWWCLLAQIVVAMFWFHPLAWWALGALRHDQELACDAAVLREHGAQRRAYANAMLKTQSALFALPVGCPWSPRHPLTERIAMLKPHPHLFSPRASGVFLALFVAGGASAVYATSAPPVSPVVAKDAAKKQEYQLDMYVQIGSNDSHSTKIQREILSMCVLTGQPGSIAIGSDLKVDATLTPQPADQVRVDLEVFGAGQQRLGQPRLLGKLGNAMSVNTTTADGKLQYALVVTPLLGCPARATAGVATKVSLQLKHVPARKGAEAVAAKAGLTLVNPQELNDAPMSFNFEDVPGDRAMQLVADIDGKRAVFDGKQVHFENK